MPIDKIGSTEHYVVVKRNFAKSTRPQQLSQVEQDTISLTKAAKQNSEMLRVRDLAMSAPDMRIERISELQNKLRDQSYPDQTVIGNLADCLLDYWNFQ